MKHYHVKKSVIQGEISVPSSKSHTLRAILFGALGKGKSIIHNFLSSNDTLAIIEACRMLGARIEIRESSLEIQGFGHISVAEDVIHAGNSGIVLRFCAAIGALGSHPIVITGDHSIRHCRTMQPLLAGLSQLGVSAKSMRGDGFAPVIIQGPIRSGTVVIDGEDSQPVSALLMAAAFAPGPIEIHVKNPGEKPWIGLTLDWLKRLGIPFENHNYERYKLLGNTSYEGFEYTVPADFSSAAFPIAAALVTQSELTLHHIDMSDSQGDKELIHLLRKMGALIEIDEASKTLYVRRGGQLCGIKADINDYIDAITVLAVVGCFAEGETLIENAAVARKKECNRIACITSELKKMGADIQEHGDGLLIKKSSLKGAAVHSFHDHRMAMSLAVAGMGAEGETRICATECVAKTFPSFVKDFKGLGALIEERRE